MPSDSSHSPSRQRPAAANGYGHGEPTSAGAAGAHVAVKSSSRGANIKGGKGPGSSGIDEVRQRFRADWRNDDPVLLEYFDACVENWKMYTGPRSQRQVAKLNAIYKQATRGDSTWTQTETSSSSEIATESAWARLKGTPKQVAMRRYITYLAEINPLIIDVMPSEKPPIGFPTYEGKPICAKCNTKGNVSDCIT